MYVPLNAQPTDAEEPGKPWHGCLLIGCYGGSSIDGTRSEVIAWLRREGEGIVDPEVLEQAVRALESA
jgi:hypothetical protein